MVFDLSKSLVIGVSSRALFDLSIEDALFHSKGLKAYKDYQLVHENEILNPGPAFPLIKAILNLNARFPSKRPVEVIIMSRNSAETSLRIFNSIQHYNLDISRAVLSGGAPLTEYLTAFNISLFLSQDEKSVEAAIQAGCASAILYSQPDNSLTELEEIRIAFDGDAVLFSEESEKIYQEEGLDAFLAHEKRNAKKPLPEGPFAKLLRALALIQADCTDKMPSLRTALVTARNGPAHERVIRTLRTWGLEVNEVFFLGGVPKSQILKAFKPHMFFDDHTGHCEEAAQFVPTGRVPAAIRKERK